MNRRSLLIAFWNRTKSSSHWLLDFQANCFFLISPVNFAALGNYVHCWYFVGCHDSKTLYNVKEASLHILQTHTDRTLILYWQVCLIVNKRCRLKFIVDII